MRRKWTGIERRNAIDSMRTSPKQWDDVSRIALELLHVEYLRDARTEEQKASFRCQASDKLATLSCYWIEPDEYIEKMRD